VAVSIWVLQIVDGTHFADSSSRHIASHFEWQFGLSPRGTLVSRTKNRPIVGIPFIGVHASRNIDSIRIDWICC
jgi:hypothetical protein